jgi:DNA-binding PadR family transcriptional regulator
MSVRQSLLAILDQGPCYGYQLRHEFDRRTGSAWPLNVGQIYNTLERLERDGLVSRGAQDEHGHVFWEISDAGRAEAAAWLSSPVLRSTAARDELAMKLSLAATLPGADVGELLRRQRAASAERVTDLRAQVVPDGVEQAEQLARALVVDAMILDAEAELRWLDHVERRLAAATDRAVGLALETRRPKRGRPAKSRSAPPLSPVA